MSLRAAAVGLLAATAVFTVAAPAANASTTTGRPGFLVSPVKATGLQPIEISNLSKVSHRYELTEVQTKMFGHNLCGPTTRPSDVLTIPTSVTVPAGKTLSVPVHIAHAPGTVTDVAVRVTQAAPRKQKGVGISVASYAQEVLGRGTARGCAVIRGDYLQKRIEASPTTPQHSNRLLLTLLLIVGLAVVLLIAAVWRLRRKGSRTAGAHAR